MRIKKSNFEDSDDFPHPRTEPGDGASGISPR